MTLSILYIHGRQPALPAFYLGSEVKNLKMPKRWILIWALKAGDEKLSINHHVGS
jgi:hypothetical protein